MPAHLLTTTGFDAASLITTAAHLNNGNLMFFGVGSASGSAAHNHVGGVFGDQNSTYLGSIQLAPAGQEIHLYYLLSPHQESVAPTVSTAGDSAAITGAVSSYGGCLSLKTANFATASGTSTTASVNVTTAVGDWVFAIAFQHATTATWTAAAGMNERADLTRGGSSPSFTCFDTVATGVLTTMSSVSTSNAQWGILAVPFSPMLPAGMTSWFF